MDHLVSLFELDACAPGPVLEVSDSLCALIGVDRKDLVGRSLLDAIAPLDRASLLSAVRELTPERPVTVVCAVNDRGGTRHRIDWVLRQVRADGVSFGLAMGRPLSSADRVRPGPLSAEHMQVIFDALTSGVVVADANGRVVLANAAALHYLGADAIAGWEAGHALTELSPDAGELLRPTGPGEQARADLTLRRGGRRPFGYNCTIAGDGHRVIVFRDLAPLVESNERRQRAEQLAQIGVMASKLSHEIRNPLASLVTGLELLERNSALPASARELARDMKQEAGRVTRTLSELLDAARPRPLAPRPLRLRVAIPEALHLPTGVAGEQRSRLDVDVGDGEMVVTLDAAVFRRVLGNLVLNALEATEGAGRVRVASRLLSTDEVQRHFGGYRHEVAVVSVRDEGPGIEDSKLAQVFRPFYTTKTKGTGLGLAVVQEAVEAHGGVLGIWSQRGRGATFHVFLPAGEQPRCYDAGVACYRPCADCDARVAGTGYCCWALTGQTARMETGRWPPQCQACAVFRRGNLLPYAGSSVLLQLEL